MLSEKHAFSVPPDPEATKAQYFVMIRKIWGPLFRRPLYIACLIRDFNLRAVIAMHVRGKVAELQLQYPICTEGKA